MEPIKTSENVEFDVIYADGTRRHVAEGVLFEAEGQRMNIHIGTSRIEVVFAVAGALTEAVKEAGLNEVFSAYIEAILESVGGDEQHGE